MTKQAAWMGTAVMGTLLALALLWQFRPVVVYFLLSLALATALRPLLQRPVGQRLAVRLGWLALYLAAFSGLILLLITTVGAAIRDAQALGQQVSAGASWRQPVWLADSSLQQALDRWLPSPDAVFAALIGDEGEFVLPAVLGFTESVFGLISGALIILFLSVYWSLDQGHFERLWLSLLPPGRRAQVRDIWRTVEADLGAYIRNQAAQTILAGLLLGLGYWLLGSPYPALLALMGALVLLIPLLGPLLAVAAPLLLGLLTSLPLALLTAVYTLIVAAVVKWQLDARLTQRAQVNPMLTILILIALADVYGLLGIILAPPLAAVCQILWGRLVSQSQFSGAAVQISEIKARQAQVREDIQLMAEPPPAVVSGLERLAALIAQAEPVLDGET
jgi:predicted PurR-regulated permease PerM